MGGGVWGGVGGDFFGQKNFFLLFHADSNHAMKYHKNLFLKGGGSLKYPLKGISRFHSEIDFPLISVNFQKFLPKAISHQCRIASSYEPPFSPGH